MKEITMKESTAKALNKCKHFEYCEIDAFGETDGYKPRGIKTTKHDEISENQLSIGEVGKEKCNGREV